MEDNGSKRRAYGIFGALFAGLAITLAMLLGKVPDADDHRAIVAALTPQAAPARDSRFDDNDGYGSYEPTATTVTEVPATEIIEGDPQVIVSKKPAR